MINFRMFVFVSALLVAAVSIVLKYDVMSEVIAKIISAISFNHWTDGEKQDLIDAWQEITASPKTTYTNILIGLNSCLDMIAPAVAILKAMNLTVPASPWDVDTITNKEEFAAVFGEYFRRGHAAERAFVDKILFSEFVTAASVAPNVKRHIGGNAALMANMIAERLRGNSTVTLVGPVGPDLEEVLSKQVRVPNSCRMAKDEVHLILEYAIGDQVGPFTASVANRFIVSHDEANTRLALLPNFMKEWTELRPELVIISGLHMTEPLPFNDWQKIISDFTDHLKRMKNQSSLIHVELASMTSKQRMFILAERVFPLVDSLGLNEQELLFLSQSLGGPHSALVGSWRHRQPGVGEVADLLIWLLSSFEDTRLSRIHFHSLTFHLIASRPARWSKTAAAVVEGARTASTRACGLDSPKSGVADLRLPRVFRLSQLEPGPSTTFVPVQGVLAWEKQGLELAMAPVLVCRHPVGTVGLGDSVSSAGLMVSKGSL